MSSPGPSGANKAADLFEELWTQLGQCHQAALQELEAKVSKLKTSRCLDAQRLEVFYNNNHQLKERNKTLQDTISNLEERIRVGECDRCSLLEQKLRDEQGQNLCLVTKLKRERKCLEDENGKLRAEVQKLTKALSELQRASAPEQEEGIIPDSPVLPSSLPVVNRLKKRKKVDKRKRVAYADLAFPQCNTSLFKELSEEPVDAPKTHGRTEVLVPNTCELDASQTSDVTDDLDTVITETCGLELLFDKKAEATSEQQSSSRPLWQSDVGFLPDSTLIHSPDSTSESSSPLLPRVKRFSEDGSVNQTKRKKEDSDDGREVEGEKLAQAEDKLMAEQSSVMKQTLNRRKGQSAQNGTSIQRLDVSCTGPAFKKPKGKVKEEAEGVKKRNPLQDLSPSHDRRTAGEPERNLPVEPMWSIDPALALSMYDSEWRGEQLREEQNDGDLADTDCTWVSHSLLHGRGRRDNGSGLGEKANDSLDMMFDTTAYGEYKSYNSSHLGQTQPCNDDDEDDEDDEDEDFEEEEEAREGGPAEDSPGGRKARHPKFAHVAVIRKKDERRKLKGTTCKECEVYYAHLPEEEKQKRLSACSRHRFLHIPPCTPENFWEVGFPSTQTCIDRGYIKEEKNPQLRTRRRLPLTALFSPKQQRNQPQS